jgi:hypothetical protein
MPDAHYDWRHDPPGVEVATAIRRRLLEGLPYFEIGGLTAVREAQEMLRWRMALDLTAIPADDRKEVLGLIHEVYDRFCEGSRDRGMTAVAWLLGYLNAPRGMEQPTQPRHTR